MTVLSVEKPRLIVFAGPNGSGKSTVTNDNRSKKEFPRIYINADDIARTELGHIPDELERNMEAAKLAQQRRQAALEGGQSFAFETVMSTPGKLATLQEARNRGFHVDLVFVATLDADINIARVQNRAALGGHDVAPDKVRERYERAMRLLPSAVDLADTVDVFDNSGREPLHVAMKRGKTLTLRNTDKAPAWVIARLAEPYHKRAASRARMAAAFQRKAAEYSGGLKSLLRDAAIWHDKTHHGLIIEADEYHVLQQVGANVYLVHDRALCPPVALNKGKTVALAYHYEKGGKPVAPVRGAERTQRICGRG